MFLLKDTDKSSQSKKLLPTLKRESMHEGEGKVILIEKQSI